METKPIRKRIEWIDWAKAFATYFVVIVHLHFNWDVDMFVNGNVIPLFFMMSGYLFSYKNNPDYGAFAWKRFRQLVVPYIWISALSYMFWLLVLRNFGYEPDPSPWYEPIRGMALCIPGLLKINIALWAFVCFFVVEMVYYPLGRLLKHPLVVAALFFILAYVMSSRFGHESAMLPFSIAAAFGGVGFYALGHWLRSQRWFEALFRGWIPAAVVLAVCVAVFVTTCWSNDKVQFYVGYYGNLGLLLLSGISGAIGVMMVSYLLTKLFGDPKLVREISVSTLLICGFHIMAFSVIVGVWKIVFRGEPFINHMSLATGFGVALLAYFLSLGLAWLVRRYARFLVDK